MFGFFGSFPAALETYGNPSSEERVVEAARPRVPLRNERRFVFGLKFLSPVPRESLSVLLGLPGPWGTSQPV
jgi:hypothetical protein